MSWAIAASINSHPSPLNQLLAHVGCLPTSVDRIRLFIDLARKSLPIEGDPRSPALLPGFPREAMRLELFAAAVRLEAVLVSFREVVCAWKLSFHDDRPPDDVLGPADIEQAFANLHREMARYELDLDDFVVPCPLFSLTEHGKPEDGDLLDQVRNGVDWVGTVFRGLVGRWGWDLTLPLWDARLRAKLGSEDPVLGIRADELAALEQALGLIEPLAAIHRRARTANEAEAAHSSETPPRVQRPEHEAPGGVRCGNGESSILATVRKFRRGELDEKASTALALNPGWTNEQVAAFLGCHVKSLSKPGMRRFQEYQRVLRSARDQYQDSSRRVRDGAGGSVFEDDDR